MHTGLTDKQRENVLENTKNGKLHALLVSPEAIVSGDSSKGFGSILKQLPPIAFACIDEVHCISQWSHNFRPSYLMVNKVLREKFGIATVLGLTATATVSTIRSITRELEIESEKGVIKDIPIPDNILLSVSVDDDKDEALIKLLTSEKFQDFNSILIYCTRRDDCERLATYIRTVMQNFFDCNETHKKKNRKLLWTAESYHAGMAGPRRKQVQKAFMNGNVRIVVATVAFGMGINKKDIRSVIHYNMPRDFESYVQEVGRAGRDGMFAHCHLFLDPNGKDVNELKRHINSNTIERHALRKLLERVFVKCDCPNVKNQNGCTTHESGFDVKKTVQALDTPEENILTLLCYLELDDRKFVKVLPPAYLNCKIKSYNGLNKVRTLAFKCPPLAYAFALDENQTKKKKCNYLDFNVIDVSNGIGWKSSIVKSQLKNLEWETDDGGTWKKTGISVEFSDLGFRVLTRGDMSPSELDESLECLVKRVENQEKRSTECLNLIYNVLEYYSHGNFEQVLNVGGVGGGGAGTTTTTTTIEKSKELKNEIRRYFETEKISEEIPLKNFQV